MSPFSDRKKVSYFACEKFLSMSALERCKILDDKGLCNRCLSSGAIKGHAYCSNRYTCKCTIHDSKTEGYHVLVCDKHKNSSDNAKLLKEFKDRYLQEFGENLPASFKNITMHSQANFVGIASEDDPNNRGIFMLQTIKIKGQHFNIFYDNGCSDLICKKSAIDRLTQLGRATQVQPGPITISGVGDTQTVCENGIYTVSLPLASGGMQ